MNILIVEDDAALSEQLVQAFEDSGHACSTASDGREALATSKVATFDVMVVDRMMPNMNGLALITELREAGDTTPVLILSAMGQVDDRVTGLRAGGDDYLTKPYAFSELLARVEVLGRRKEQMDGASNTSLKVGDLTLDRIEHRAQRGEQAIALLPREYRLLDYLMQNAGRIVTRTMLLEKVWDLHFDPQTNVIDVHISRLRAKIDKNFDTPLLHTVRGRGYKLSDEG